MMRFMDAISAESMRRASGAERACCVYARNVLVRVYGSEAIRRVPLERWHLWADRPTVGPWEPVLAAVDAGIGVETLEPVLGRWHLVQGWRGSVERWPLPPGSNVSGHTFLWLHAGSAGLQADSSEDRGTRERVREWSQLQAEFRGGLRLAALHRPG